MDIEDRESEAEIMFDIILTARQLGESYNPNGSITVEDLTFVGRIVADGKALNDMYDTYTSPPTSAEPKPDLTAPQRAVDDTWKEGLA